MGHGERYKNRKDRFDPFEKEGIFFGFLVFQPGFVAFVAFVASVASVVFVGVCGFCGFTMLYLLNLSV